jgi:type III pantothenate kinase
MRAGAVWGAAQEIEGFIRQFDDDTGRITVILTGGDAALLGRLLKRSVLVETHLVLIGLNKILTYNVE